MAVVLRRLCFTVALALAVVTGMFVGTAQQSPADLGVPFLGRGGGVQGTVFLRVLDGATGRMVLVPDFEVVLQNVATQVSSPPAKTDFSGHFVFPTQEPGTYELRWKTQGGWQEGVLGKKIVIATGTQNAGGVEIKPQLGQGLLVGRVRRANGSSPWVNEAFFDVSLVPQVSAFSHGRQVAEAVRTNVSGEFVIAGLPRAPLELRAIDEAAVVSQEVPANAVSFDGHISPVTLNFTEQPPRILSIVAKVNQSEVSVVAPGATTTVVVNARGFGQNALRYDWRVQKEMGTISPAGNSAVWTLPTTPQPYTAYVMVSDGFGNYVTGSVSVVVAAKAGVTGQVPMEASALNTNRTSTGNVSQFATLAPLLITGAPSIADPLSLAFNGRADGTPTGAADYYALVDPGNQRMTLTAWWTMNGFGPNGTAAGEVRTSYLNNNDLGSGRDMHVLYRPNGDVAAYVTNYLHDGLFDQNPNSADDAANQVPPPIRAATVCMEWSPNPQSQQNPPQRIVKFFVYNTSGARLSSLDLLGTINGVPQAPKYIPELCLNCHGGDNSGQADLKASFREFDTATFRYTGGRAVPNAAEMAAFKRQNFIVRGKDNDNISTTAIKQLVNGWYHWYNIRDIPVQIPVNGGVLYIDPHPGNTAEDNSFVPPGWANTTMQNQMLYTGVVAKSCRTCHVAFTNNINTGNGNSGIGIDWTSSLQYVSDGLTKSYVQEGEMPHAPVTFTNFWSDPVEVAIFKSVFPF